MNEDDYAKTRHGYEDRVGLVDLVLEWVHALSVFVVAGMLVGLATFLVMSIAGFIWGKS